VLILFAALPGCGDAPDDTPETGHVTGKVTLDGQAVEGARIYFRPNDGGQTSEAVTDAEGKYELRYKREMMGAKLGMHKVVITTLVEDQLADDASVIKGKPESIPAKYNAETTLTAEVKAGENPIDFPLESK
jgi:hypothetical protein